METLIYDMQSWTVAQKFNRLKNLRVVKPPYEEDGYYSDKFFLDKRLWLKNMFTSTGKKFYDKVTIKWIDYYYYFQWNQSYVWVFTWPYTWLTPIAWPFNVWDNSPRRVVLGKWLVWPKSSTRTIQDFTWVTWVKVELWGNIDFTLIPWYAWGYVAFNYSWTKDLAVWDYIFFRGWWLTGWINRIEYIDSNNNIYIIWTSIRWTLPQVWLTFDVYKQATTQLWNTIVVWHNNWVTACLVNGTSSANTLQVLTTSTTEPIIDITLFNNNIFAMSPNLVLFSNSVQYSNMMMFVLDRFEIDNWESFFSMWKAMLVFSKTNKLISAANGTDQNIWYVMYDLNYTSDKYSKYANILTGQSIYIVEDDKELKQVNITQSNSSTFDIETEEVLWLNRWIFNWLSWWEMNIISNERYINFLYIKDNKTINYQYDKMYKHIIEQHYNYPIYFISWNEILSDWIIFNEEEWYYLDNAVAYEQEVNFSIDTEDRMYMPWLIKTMFGLIDSKFNVELNINYEVWAKIYYIKRILNNFMFDNRLSNSLTWDEMIWWDTVPLEQSYYDWTTVSIMSRIFQTWRFFNFKYNSYDRFVIGNSYIFTNKSKPFINEPLLTN